MSNNTKQEITVLCEYRNGVGWPEALKLAGNKRLLSNKEADALLQDEESRKTYAGIFYFYCWTGTLVMYAAAGQPFKEYLKFRDIVFEIPKKFQGMEDKALVIEHPGWGIEEFTKIKAEEKDIDIIDLPAQDGWYLPDEKHGIPNGKCSNSSDSAARYLYRRDDGDYIGPLARCDFGVFGVFSCRRDVYADRKPVNGLGVGVVEPKPKKGKAGAKE